MRVVGHERVVPERVLEPVRLEEVLTGEGKLRGRVTGIPRVEDLSRRNPPVPVGVQVKIPALVCSFGRRARLPRSGEEASGGGEPGGWMTSRGRLKIFASKPGVKASL